MTIKNSALKGARPGSILVSVHDTDESRVMVNAAVSIYLADGDCANFVASQWHSDPARHVATAHTDRRGAAVFDDLAPGAYVVLYNHYPLTAPQCITVQPGCAAVACFTLGLNAAIALTYETADCQPSNCRQPRVTDRVLAMVSFDGDASELRDHVEVAAAAPWTALRDDRFVFGSTVRRPGAHLFDAQLMFAPRADIGLPAGLALAGPNGPKAILALGTGFDAEERVPTPVTGNIGVSLTRTETEPSEDLPLWTLIRNSTDAMGFTNYMNFIDSLFCADKATTPGGFEGDRFARKAKMYDKLRTRRTLPFIDSDAYRVLKAATEAFVMVNCGVMNAAMAFDPVSDVAYLDRRDIPPGRDMATVFDEYLTTIDGTQMLPYLAIIRRKLPDVPITVPHGQEEDADLCFGIVQKKLSSPCMLELIWSYWNEEGALVQTMNAITQRFQNVRARPNDPLANLEIDPLRPLNNLIWGYTQDEQHRLTVVRRNYEYDHHYGIRLDGKAVQNFRPADSRSKFLEAFHFLLRLCTSFFRQDDDTTVKADAFPVLNALKEVHLILSQGAHNQFGDLPSTARVEMLMKQWLLSRPEFREFLPTRIMVAYPEPWMDRVDAMKKLQGWSDTSVMHFRSLAMFGEQLLLTIRYGNWSDVYEPTQAFNWARYWRPQIQGYIHSYRAATGVDLTASARDQAAEGTMPSLLMRQRLAEQARGAQG
ncbi:MAG: 8-amino-7-oxononanoate synthase [Massilia sp.]